MKAKKPLICLDTCVVISLLNKNNDEFPEDLKIIRSMAERGEIDILVSSIAVAEALYIPGEGNTKSEVEFEKFFSMRYVIVESVDGNISKRAAKLRRDLHDLSKEQFEIWDSLHIATALIKRADAFISVDDKPKKKEFRGREVTFVSPFHIAEKLQFALDVVKPDSFVASRKNLEPNDLFENENNND